MASTEMTTSAAAASASSKTVPEHGYGAAPPNYFGLDFALRLLLFASSLSALVLMVTSKQTKLFPTLMPPPYPSFVSKEAKFNHSPALIYLVAALATASFYSFVTFLASASAIAKPSPSGEPEDDELLYSSYYGPEQCNEALAAPDPDCQDS